MSSYLLYFERNGALGFPPDLGEQIGDLCLTPLRTLFGRKVQVSNRGAVTLFKEESYSSVTRFSHVALPAILSSQTGVIGAACAEAVAAGLGCAGYLHSKTHQAMIDEYQKYKDMVDAFSKLDISKQSDLDTLCKKLPLYDAQVPIDPKEDVSSAAADFQASIGKQLQCLDTEQLIRDKTAYLKRRDIAKFAKHQGRAIPNPSLVIQLTDPIIFKTLPLPPLKAPFTKIPEYLYKYDHPYDSVETRPLFGLVGAATPGWKVVLDYVETEVLPKPLKNFSAKELFQLFFTLHAKLVGSEEKIRDEVMIVGDPRKLADLSFNSMRRYLQRQGDADASVTRCVQYVERIDRIEQKLLRWENLEQASQYFTPKEWEALQKAAFIPPSPEGLEKKLMDFCEKAHTLMQESRYHPVQIGAFLHYGFTTSHPALDRNGTVSRLIAIIYQMQNGVDPFFVVQDAHYTDLFKAESYDMAYGKYLIYTWKEMKQIEGGSMTSTCIQQ